MTCHSICVYAGFAKSLAFPPPALKISEILKNGEMVVQRIRKGLAL